MVQRYRWSQFEGCCTFISFSDVECRSMALEEVCARGKATILDGY